jgi:hypothetical protein
MEQGGIYLDAVLDMTTMEPLFNSTPENVAEWLVAHAEDWKSQQNIEVCVGRTMQMKTIDEYLRAFG